MLATQVRQKDAVFYFVGYPAEDLLAKVRFISRFYSDGGSIRPDEAPPEDEVATFIAKIEHTDSAFQRVLSRQKVKAIQNFYETKWYSKVLNADEADKNAWIIDALCQEL